MDAVYQCDILVDTHKFWKFWRQAKSSVLQEVKTLLGKPAAREMILLLCRLGGADPGEAFCVGNGETSLAPWLVEWKNHVAQCPFDSIEVIQDYYGNVECLLWLLSAGACVEHLDGAFLVDVMLSMAGPCCFAVAPGMKKTFKALIAARADITGCSQYLTRPPMDYFTDVMEASQKILDMLRDRGAEARIAPVPQVEKTSCPVTKYRLECVAELLETSWSVGALLQGSRTKHIYSLLLRSQVLSGTKRSTVDLHQKSWLKLSKQTV